MLDFKSKYIIATVRGVQMTLLAITALKAKEIDSEMNKEFGTSDPNRMSPEEQMKFLDKAAKIIVQQYVSEKEGDEVTIDHLLEHLDIGDIAFILGCLTNPQRAKTEADPKVVVK